MINCYDVDCHLFVDEGWWLLPSMDKISMEELTFILSTRHMSRTINIISQRTMNIAKTARGMVNRYYKCERKNIPFFLYFKRTEFQQMADENVDENEDNIVSLKVYRARSKVLNIYNSKYLRSAFIQSQKLYIQAYQLTAKERLRALLRSTLSRGVGLSEPTGQSLRDSITN